MNSTLRRRYSSPWVKATSPSPNFLSCFAVYYFKKFLENLKKTQKNRKHCFVLWTEKLSKHGNSDDSLYENFLAQGLKQLGSEFCSQGSVALSKRSTLYSGERSSSMESPYEFSKIRDTLSDHGCF